MAERSPDGRTVRCSGTVGLGHGALHTTPESLDEALPLATSEGLLITGDLRIDNRSDLLRDLSIDSADGREVGDAELVLRTYMRRGIETPKRLLGAFAFAIWDPRSGEMFCARDHFGAKPFVYHLSRDLFVFASEENGVLAGPGVPRRVNEARVADFLVSELEGIDHTSTFYLDLLRLPPSHILIVRRDSYRLNRYWSPDPSYELHLADDEEYVEAFHHTLQQAVGACLRSSTQPAVMLSGGIDSGAVAAFATELHQQSGGPRVQTLSAIDDEDQDCEESACIRASIEMLGARADIVNPAYVRSLSPERRRSILDCGNPFDRTMTVPDLLYEKAQSSGARVVLDGVDGDVVMSLGGTHIAHLGAIADSVINPDFARRINLAERLERHDRNRWFVASGDARRDQGENLLHPYVAVGLERYDRVASRWGIDVRHPLFDLRFVELCLSLPWHLKNRNGWTKYILRSATKGVLPEQVRWRRNNANVMSLFTSMVVACERSFAQEIIENHACALGAYVDIGAVRSAYARLEEHPNWLDELHLCEAVALALWFGRTPP
ncbi:MAG: hypothetical protein IFK92_15670 [Acidobacteria bacterium]|nr:hypothetical protein [Candidatus Sulfomarinibacter kjeldsenii]